MNLHYRVDGGAQKNWNAKSEKAYQKARPAPKSKTPAKAASPKAKRG